jgi:hypothetical protein
MIARLFILLCLICCMGTTAAHSKKAPEVIERHAIHDEASFNSLTEIKKITPFNKSSLEFFILIPKDWETLEISADQAGTLTQRILGDVARFQSPLIGTSRLKVNVQYLSLENEIDARAWLKNYIFTGGYAPDGEVTATNKNRASGFYAVVNEAGSNYIYATAHISGNAVFLAMFEAPFRLKTYAEFLQKRTIDSFVLRMPKQTAAESQIQSGFRESLQFSYPQSWKVSAQNADVDQQNLQLVNKNDVGTTLGLIQIQAVRRNAGTTAKKEILRMQKYLRDSAGLDFADMTEAQLPPMPERFVFKRYEIYNVTSRTDAKNKNNRDLHFVMLGDAHWYIFAFLLTPKEKVNLMVNARNLRSFERVLESFR